jgi:hypothetical protein
VAAAGTSSGLQSCRKTDRAERSHIGYHEHF